MPLTQIHLAAMRRLIEDVRAVGDEGESTHRELSGLLDQADLGSGDAAAVRTAGDWLTSQVPMLRRRLALAEEVEASTPGIQASVQIDESQLSELTPEEAEELAQELADQIADGPYTQRLAEQLGEHASDPYFASALLDALSPEELAAYLESVDMEVQRTGQADLDYARTHGGVMSGLRLALQTAARAEELPEGYAEALAEVIMTGDGEDAVALADFLSATQGLHADIAVPTADARAVIEGYHELVDEGVLADPPAAYLREWLQHVQAQGGDPVALAQQEGVDDRTFDLLEELEVMRDPDGRAYFLITTKHGEDARRIAELTELLAGGEPSSNAWRRDANSWTFDTWFGDGDIDLVLDDGAALAATPHGIFMAVGEDRLMPSTTDLFAYEGGTMWGEIFMVNDESSDPAARLRDMVENDTKDPPDSIHPLWRVLRHEKVHAQQWARYGYSGFIARYLWHNPLDPCGHPMEEEAGFEDGGYFQCVD
ncbi:hypothetical protein [Serinicoccus marinus]|uniref:hypothetical protein n=1 Tax=Serinicoccus marinus TaxID=247333 RepID=UPI0004160915|nr:hypothetical protein [Serinicoccus marinus]